MGHMFKGQAYVPNKATPLIIDYLNRKALSKLGYMEPLEQLDCFTANAFIIISSAIVAAEQASMKRGRNGRK